MFIFELCLITFLFLAMFAYFSRTLTPITVSTVRATRMFAANASVLPRVFFDIKINNKDAGRMVFEV